MPYKRLHSCIWFDHWTNYCDVTTCLGHPAMLFSGGNSGWGKATSDCAHYGCLQVRHKCPTSGCSSCRAVSFLSWRLGMAWGALAMTSGMTMKMKIYMKDLHMLKDNKVMTFAAIWLSEVDDDDAERQEKIENGLVNGWRSVTLEKILNILRWQLTQDMGDSTI